MRHAQRAAGIADSLSADGFKEAQKRAKELKLLFSPLEKMGQLGIFCSPKNRTQQTAKMLSQEFAVPYQVDLRLDEKSSAQTPTAYTQQINSFLEFLLPHQEIATLTIVISHMDWLEVITEELGQSENESFADFTEPWTPCSFRVYEWTNQKWNRVKQQERSQ